MPLSTIKSHQAQARRLVAAANAYANAVAADDPSLALEALDALGRQRARMRPSVKALIRDADAGGPTFDPERWE